MDYHFVSEAQFETWIKEGQLLEHALVYGDYKGIPRPQARPSGRLFSRCPGADLRIKYTYNARIALQCQVEAAIAAGKDVILRIDVQGAATVRSMLPGVVSVFLVSRGLHGDQPPRCF